jgi:glutamate dehydrogenase
MTTSGLHAHRRAVDEVVGFAHERLSGDAAAEARAFLETWFERIPPEDLAARPPAEWYGAAMAHRRFGAVRQPGQALARVFNPSVEEEGWQSVHSVVEVVTDNMPFLVDSVTMAVARAGHAIHLVVHPMVPVRRDPTARWRRWSMDAPVESWMHVEIDRVGDPARRERLLEAVQSPWWTCGRPWTTGRPCERAPWWRWRPLVVPATAPSPTTSGARLRSSSPGWPTTTSPSSARATTCSTAVCSRSVPGTGLGLLRDDVRPATPRVLDDMTPSAAGAVNERRLLVVTRARARSTVHRPDHLAYVGIKRFGPGGSVVGERRFIGLWTALAYRSSAMEVPFLERRIRAVLERADAPLDTHDGRALWNILETYPRDELFQLPVEELHEVATRILALQERKQVRLFARHDPFGRFVSCLVFLPRDRYSALVQERIVDVLMDAYGGESHETDVLLGDSVLARVHVVVFRRPDAPADTDDDQVERRVVAVCRWWLDELRDALVESEGEDVGLELLARFRDAFPASYREATGARAAVADVRRLMALEAGDGLVTALQWPVEGPDDEVRLKLYTARAVTLSSVLPLLEHLGVSVTDERPFQVRPLDGPAAWLYDVGLRTPHARRLAEPEVRAAWQESFAGLWKGELEDDPLNRLVLAAGLPARDVTVLRAYLRYLRQVGIPYASRFMEDTLVKHSSFATGLARLFRLRFDPSLRADELAVQATGGLVTAEVAELAAALDGVDRLDEDRVLRAFLALVLATARTNAYRSGGGCAPAGRRRGPGRPAMERSDRGLPHRGPRADEGPDGEERRDRPVGAKGGFVVRRPPEGSPLRAEVEACYRAFIGGLLDVTDNLVGGPGGPPRGRGPPRRRRPLPGGGGRQGHGHLLRHRQRGGGRVRLLAGRRLRLRGQRRLRPQEGWPSPPAAPGSA